MPTLNKIRSALAGSKGRASQSPTAAPSPDLRRFRAALTAFFALDGFVFAGWVVRIPAVKEQTGASAGALGLALLGVSAGAVATMVLTGRLCSRFGNQPVVLTCAFLLPLSVALPPLTHSALTLGLVLLVFGVAYGGMNVALNSTAVDLIAALRRPVMPGFHAAFSLGGMLGAGLGGFLAGHLSVTRHLLLLTVTGLAVAALGTRPLTRYEPRPAQRADRPGDAARPSGRARRLVAVLGLIALCTAYGEGALADWSALHLTDDLGASAGMAASGYSVFAGAMTLGRLSGTTLVERLGPGRVLIAGGALGSCGMLLGSLGPSVWLVLAGFVLTGLGLANVFPIAIGRAGDLAGPGGVAAASTFGYGGILLGPVAIGFLTDWFSLTAALLTVAVLAAFASLTAWATRHAVLPEE
ncbi:MULTISPECIES: MFS transporter [unclassified Streptomyces]|uniref:MFS transporter n=1 Tax=unclassified Streptomyces TaxID=2593676 RepID=UPI002DD8D60F|nr:MULTISPECIES: MFS transporter [unclassified Streptomyces]WSA90279.1 MFS transporter [Streptomyces sp. NBC_01795]WSB74504.1 MFS transporter [Streptomyces sp. NBC_01775]WSS17111.1 MFS transporter [Streptomyces sp. NBC_01186]WSS45855.1 MFS transporter [Streptomyces sp. NBC_01187]